MKINFNDFSKDPPDLVRKQLSAIEGVIRSGNFVLGKKVEEFEDLWAEYCGVTDCAGVASGLDALELILRARNIGPGDEVITTSLTAFATVLAIVKVGATPVFADVTNSDCLLDPASVLNLISESTRAIVLVHLYGRLSKMGHWVELCDRYNIDLIEDCAQAHGAEEGGRKAGSWGIAAAFSFYPTKNLGCLGDGGAVVSSNTGLIERVKRLRNYGQDSKYVHNEIGLNSRLDEMQAAILTERLRYLDVMNKRRREIADKYRQYFDSSTVDGVELLDREDNPSSHVHHLFVARVDQPLRYIAAAQDLGVPLLVHYPRPCHLQLALNKVHTRFGTLLNTEFNASHLISLPCHPNLTDEEVAHVFQAICAISNN